MITTTVEAVLVIFCVGWLLITALYQVRDIAPIKAIFDTLPADIIGILPIWTFFSPVPGHTDVHVAVRGKTESGDTEQWEEIDLIAPRSLSKSLFNPQRRLTKAMIDIVSEVTRSSQFDAELYNDFYNFQPTHLFLLNLSLSRFIDNNYVQIQYVVFVTRGFSNEADIQVICRSDYHDV